MTQNESLHNEGFFRKSFLNYLTFHPLYDIIDLQIERR